MREVSLRDLLRLGGVGVIAATGIGFLGDHFVSTAPESKDLIKVLTAREKARPFDDVEPVESGRAWETMLDLCSHYGVQVGMMGDGVTPAISGFMTDPYFSRPKNDVQFEDIKTGAELIQGHARMYFANITNTRLDMKYEDYYLKEYLPNAIKLIAAEGISLDTYVSWMLSAEAVVQTNSTVQPGNYGQNKDVDQSRLQYLFGFVEAYLMDTVEKTTLTDFVKLLDFQDSTDKSVYDAPRAAKVTVGKMDMEHTRIARGFFALDEKIRTEFSEKYPWLVEAMHNLVEDDQHLDFLRDTLAKTVSSYFETAEPSEGIGTIVDQMLGNMEHPSWELMGWGNPPSSDTARLHATKYGEIWKNFYKLVHSGVGKTEAISQAFVETKKWYCDRYQDDIEETRKLFVQDMMENRKFHDLIRSEASTDKMRLAAVRMSLTYGDFLDQALRTRKSVSEMAIELDPLEYDDSVQNPLFVGIVKESIELCKSSEFPNISSLMHIPQFESFISMWLREVAPLPILASPRDKFMRHRQVDEPYEPKTILRCMENVMSKIDKYGKPAQAEDMLSLTRRVFYQMYQVGIAEIPDKNIWLDFMNSTEWKNDVDLQRDLALLGFGDLDVPNSLVGSMVTANMMYGEILSITKRLD